MYRQNKLSSGVQASCKKQLQKASSAGTLAPDPAIASVPAWLSYCISLQTIPINLVLKHLSSDWMDKTIVRTLTVFPSCVAQSSSIQFACPCLPGAVSHTHAHAHAHTQSYVNNKVLLRSNYFTGIILNSFIYIHRLQIKFHTCYMASLWPFPQSGGADIVSHFGFSVRRNSQIHKIPTEMDSWTMKTNEYTLELRL